MTGFVCGGCGSPLCKQDLVGVFFSLATLNGQCGDCSIGSSACGDVNRGHCGVGLP